MRLILKYSNLGTLCFLSAFMVNTNSYAVQITGLSLINTDTSQPIAGFNPISNGQIIDLKALPTRNITLRANVDSGTASVVFGTDSGYEFVANQSPFALCGTTTSSGYVPCSVLSLGSRIVGARPFSGKGATGSSGTTLKRSFTIVDTTPQGCTKGRGMWLWTSKTVLSDLPQQDQLVSVSQALKVTEIYMYLVASDYTTRESAIRTFVAKLSKAGIKAWGLDGDRAYFSDVYGPARLYASADALIAYNTRVAASERFIGFHTDMEPNDGQGPYPTTFHNDYTDSELSTTGGGVWFSTQALDREMLMRDWLEITQTLKNKLKTAGLKLGGAMPSWTDNFYGEPVRATFNGVRQGVMEHHMAMMDDYVIMSYNTSPTNVVGRISGEVAYAGTIPADKRPRVLGGLDVHPGGGSGSSYADTPGKNSRAVVLADMATIEALMSAQPGFCGMSFHDWEGWRNLNP